MKNYSTSYNRVMQKIGLILAIAWIAVTIYGRYDLHPIDFTWSIVISMGCAVTCATLLAITPKTEKL